MHTHEIIEIILQKIAGYYQVDWQELLHDHKTSCQVIYQLNDYLELEMICDLLSTNNVSMKKHTFLYYLANAEELRANDKEFNAIYLQVREELRGQRYQIQISNAA